MEKLKKIKQKCRICMFTLINIGLLALPVFAATEDTDTRPRITSYDFSDLTNLLLKLATWVFGISGLIVGVSFIKSGIKIAYSKPGPSGQADIGDQLWHVILGACICFGSWFLVGLFKGLLVK